jgi:membrane protein DedA with SNARE-associated domain
MSVIYAIVSDVEPYVATYGVVVIFVMVYLESFGTPLPGETGVVTAALLAAKGDLAVAPLFAAVLAGAVLGDGTGYLIGRIGGRRLIKRFGPRVNLTPERFTAIEAQFQAKGFWLVAAARFLPLLRQLNGVIAGSLEMRWRTFALANMIGAAAWAAVWVFGPYFFADVFRAWR